MNDALAWGASLLFPDLSRLIGGIMLIALIIEFLFRFRKWIR